MRTRDLRWEKDVLAFDRTAQCLRVVDGTDCEILDEYGCVVEGYCEVDTDLGTARFPGDGKVRVERGRYYVVVKKEKAAALSSRTA